MTLSEEAMSGRRGLLRNSGIAATLVGAALVMVAAVHVAAAPMNGEVATIRQADGTFIELRVWGDEFYAVGETQDGYTVVRDPDTGVYCYARLSADGDELLSTGVRADSRTAPAGLNKHIRVDSEAAAARARTTRREFRERAFRGFDSPPTPTRSRGTSTGDVVGITLIVDFSDDVGTIPPSEIDDYCNLEGYSGYGNNGSVHDYFDDVSGGLLNYTNYVPTFYYRASHTKSYYCDPSVSYGTRAQQLIAEALNALDDAGFDFSQYDADGDGVVDALNCFYAGDTWNNWAEGLWPHCGWLQWCADGVCTQRYQISDIGDALKLSTFCHENGHMLMGWPDLYDYDGDSSGVGTFCLMCSMGSSTNPIQPCAYMKYQAGWANISQPSGYQSDLTAPSTGNVVYKFDHPTLFSEYYLIENRQKTGRDASIPDHGLAVWHCDENGSNNWQQQTPDYHYEVTLVQADGDWDLENHRNYGDGFDLYAASLYTECSPLTYPDTDWWDGTESGYYFMDISSSGSTMTFDFADGPPFNVTFSAPVYAAEKQCSETAVYSVTLHNPGSQSGSAELGIAHECLPDGVGPSDWVASYREVGGPWLSSPTTFDLGPGENVDLEVRVEDTIGTVAGMDVACLTATCTTDPDVTGSISLATFFDAPSILVVDDDAGASNETYIDSALIDAGYSGHVWDADGRGRPTSEQLNSYWAVFWTTAQGSADYIEAPDEQNIIDYLDGGGNLFFASTHYLSSRAATNALIDDYLRVGSWTDDAGGFALDGVAGDQISDGMYLLLLGGPISPNYAETIVPAGSAQPILTNSGNAKALKVEEDGHKVVFLAFAFENVKTSNEDPDNQKTLVSRTIEWFQDGTGVDEFETVGADRLAISQNYPNPFNPVTVVSFTIPEAVERASVRVYNVNGQQVRTLVDGPLSAGTRSVRWDGRDDSGRPLGSGIYFARLEADGEIAQRKMTLIK
ncbi:MAG: M6 family metalloprotease domain-containing protein [Candidatus Eisenbacteria bacterium]|nr:M6 family metalloprotease domain-containing protein [Candidatus Eisenbacteria bacterium]